MGTAYNVRWKEDIKLAQYLLSVGLMLHAVSDMLFRILTDH